MKPITVKALIAELSKLDGDAIVLVPGEPGERYARPLSPRCNDLMEVEARPVRRSKVIARKRRPGDSRPARYRVRWTDYELRLYGHSKREHFGMRGIYFNILDH